PPRLRARARGAWSAGEWACLVLDLEFDLSDRHRRRCGSRRRVDRLDLDAHRRRLLCLDRVELRSLRIREGNVGGCDQLALGIRKDDVDVFGPGLLEEVAGLGPGRA